MYHALRHDKQATVVVYNVTFANFNCIFLLMYVYYCKCIGLVVLTPCVQSNNEFGPILFTDICMYCKLSSGIFVMCKT